MTILASAEIMASEPSDGRFIPVAIRREDDGGLVFLSCDTIPELFVAVKSDDEIRSAIDFSLKSAFQNLGRRVQVFTNGKITEPTIDAVVRITE